MTEESKEKKVYPNLLRTGKPQNYRQRVATKLNWITFGLKGAAGHIGAMQWSFHWITSQKEWISDVSQERRSKLMEIRARVVKLVAEIRECQSLIEEYYKLDPGPKKKRTRQTPQEGTENPSQATKKSPWS